MLPIGLLMLEVNASVDRFAAVQQRLRLGQANELFVPSAMFVHCVRPTWYTNPAFLDPPPCAMLVCKLLPDWYLFDELNALAGKDIFI